MWHEAPRQTCVWFEVATWPWQLPNCDLIIRPQQQLAMTI